MSQQRLRVDSYMNEVYFGDTDGVIKSFNNEGCIKSDRKVSDSVVSSVSVFDGNIVYTAGSRGESNCGSLEFLSNDLLKHD